MGKEEEGKRGKEEVRWRRQGEVFLQFLPFFLHDSKKKCNFVADFFGRI